MIYGRAVITNKKYSIFSRRTHKLYINVLRTLSVCDCIGTVYTCMNSWKEAFNPIMNHNWWQQLTWPTAIWTKNKCILDHVKNFIENHKIQNFWIWALFNLLQLSLSQKPQEIEKICGHSNGSSQHNNLKEKIHQNWMKNINSFYLLNMQIFLDPLIEMK